MTYPGEVGVTNSPERLGMVAWEDVDDAAGAAFSIWVEQPELEWARRAWGVLAQAGLTAYSSERGRLRVLVRFVALADIYHQFCHLAWGEYYKPEYGDPDYGDWADRLGLTPVRIGVV